jgi:hypothetical protein
MMAGFHPRRISALAAAGLLPGVAPKRCGRVTRYFPAELTDTLRNWAQAQSDRINQAKVLKRRVIRRKWRQLSPRTALGHLEGSITLNLNVETMTPREARQWRDSFRRVSEFCKKLEMRANGNAVSRGSL